MFVVNRKTKQFKSQWVELIMMAVVKQLKELGRGEVFLWINGRVSSIAATI